MGRSRGGHEGTPTASPIVYACIQGGGGGVGAAGDRSVPAVCREMDLSETAVRTGSRSRSRCRRAGRADDRGARGVAAVAAGESNPARRARHLEAGGDFLRDGDPMSRYRFVEAESRRYPVAQVCRIAEVSRAAYYEWKTQPASTRAQADAALTALIRAIHAASDGQYGVPRVLVELRAQGHAVGRKRVARLMKRGVTGAPPRWCRRPRRSRRHRRFRIWSTGTSARRRPTCSGSVTSRTSARGRAGCIWPPSSTSSRGA